MSNLTSLLTGSKPLNPHCRVGKVTFKERDLTLHIMPPVAHRSKIRNAIIEGVHVIDTEGEPMMYCGFMVWPTGKTAVTWEWTSDEPTEEMNARELERCLTEMASAVRGYRYGD